MAQKFSEFLKKPSTMSGLWQRHQTAFVVWTLAAFLSLLTLYLLWIAKDIQAVFFDTYEVYIDAQIFAGTNPGTYHWKRPPFLPWLFTPAFRFADLQTALLISRILAVGFFSGLLAAAYRLFRFFLGPVPAAFGVLLMGTNALLIHYAPFVKEDLPATFFTVLSFILFLRARKEGKTPLYVTAGLALGLTAITRFNMFSWMAATLALYELFSPESKTARFPFLKIRDVRKKFLFLFLLPALLSFSALPLAWAMALRMSWIEAIPKIYGALWNIYSNNYYSQPQSPLEILWFLGKMITWPLLLLCGIGFYTAWKERAPGALLMTLWMVIFLAQQALLTHHEARYLFPVFPPVFFFIAVGMAAIGRVAVHGLGVRGGSSPLFRMAAFVLGILSCVPYAGAFVDELSKFQDPFYRTPYVENVSRTAKLLAQNKDIYWVGGMYPLHPERYLFPPLNSATYAYDVYNHSVRFYTDKLIRILGVDKSFFYLAQSEGGRPVIFVANLLEKVRDGDVCIIYPTLDTPVWPCPLWVQRCRVIPLTASSSDPAAPVLRFTSSDGPARLQMENKNGQLRVVVSGLQKGMYQLYLKVDRVPDRQMSAMFESKDGTASFLVRAPKGAIQSCTLLTFDKVYIFPHPTGENKKNGR